LRFPVPESATRRVERVGGVVGHVGRRGADASIERDSSNGNTLTGGDASGECVDDGVGRGAEIGDDRGIGIGQRTQLHTAEDVVTKAPN